MSRDGRVKLFGLFMKPGDPGSIPGSTLFVKYFLSKLEIYCNDVVYCNTHFILKKIDSKVLADQPIWPGPAHCEAY